MTIEEKEQEIIDEFSIYDDWMDKYAYLIELGSGLEGMDEAHKTEENLIKGMSVEGVVSCRYAGWPFVFYS